MTKKEHKTFDIATRAKILEEQAVDKVLERRFGKKKKRSKYTVDVLEQRILDRAEGKPVKSIDEITGEIIEDLPIKKKRENHHSRNTITPLKQKFSKLYQWSNYLATEQQEEPYVWNFETQQLLSRLSTVKGCFIAIIGLQGVGKTALKQALETNLLNKKKQTVLSFKWNKKFRTKEYMENLEIGSDKYEADNILETLSTRFDRGSLLSTWVFICKKAGLKPELGYTIKDFYRHKNVEPRVLLEVLHMLPQLKKLLSKEDKQEFHRGLWLDKIQTTDTILIDLPDYSRDNLNQLTKDLRDIGEFWENYVVYDPDGIYKQKPNVVLFFQKELFYGHFLLGKLDVFELKPLTPNELKTVMLQNGGSIEPFTEEAVLYIGSLSRGIIRRFKKYIRICLEKRNQYSCNSITPLLVKKWITLEQLEKDMELELMTVFPKQKELRKQSVILLQLLREKNELTQPQITEQVFNNAKMKCSRVLDKLEAWNYIQRSWGSTKEARVKIVKLKESV